MDKNNFLWQHIDLNQKLIQDLQNVCKKSISDSKVFFQPLNVQIEKILGFTVTHSVLIFVPPFSESLIHTDYRSDNLKLALNIGLENCDSSCTELWENVSSEVHVRYTELGIPYNFLEKNKCKKITEFRLNRPVIFNTKVPHSVRNWSSSPRLSLSFRFSEDPWKLVSML
jgi:aromatic ring-opening dioxygenase LigB subunit